ncbi:Heat shock 22 kDa protein [Scenedesmus sp. PABB004]|nr:Heat shock 22 kDa protein [Scenedesmus sp. PABB004]
MASRRAGGVLLLLALLCAAAASPGAAATPAGRSGRQLLQTGVTCAAQIPACTARRCTTRILDSRETYVCLRCQRTYVPVRGSDGRSVVQCVCPPGTFQVKVGSTRECRPCPFGSYCPGGDRSGKSAAEDAIGGLPISCGTGLTTKAERTARASDCIARAGYVLPAQPGSPGVRCTGDSYAPEANKLRTCLPCQSGLSAPPSYIGARAKKELVCQVPPGRFWELNVVRDCPQGLYREEYVLTTDAAAIKCLSCPPGWTTTAKGATARAACSKLLPGFQLKGAPLDDPSVTLPQDEEIVAADICPYGYYNDGTVYSCKRCPLDTTTETVGARSVNDCQVPPGYYVQMSGSTGTLAKCPTNVNGTGYYRSGWVSPTEAKSTGDGTDVCKPCGKGVLSEYRDFDEIGDQRVVMANDPFPGRVASSSASCFIEQGWGLNFDPEDFSAFKAVQCAANSYGVAQRVYGLYASPCKACTKNTRSPLGAANYNECTNPVGFGYTSEGANQCPDGFYNAAESMDPCTPCPPGRTTDYIPGDGTPQASIHDCKAPAGNGVFDANADNPWAPPQPSASMGVKPCPVGYRAVPDTPSGVATNNPLCLRCPAGTSTSGPGAVVCDVCAAGFGIPASKPTSTNPADCMLCTYGTFHAGGGLRCSACPTTAFNHPSGDTYTSAGITFATGMVGPETCVPRYAQLPAPAGHRLALDGSLFNVTTGRAFVDCIESCPAAQCCIAQFETAGGTCKHATLPPVGPGYVGARLYYKLPPSELVSSASTTGTKLWAKTQPAGVYTRCVMDAQWVAKTEAGLVGTSTNPALVEETNMAKGVEWGECDSELACRLKCETNAACWGFVFVPGKGWATRGGEDQIGTRSFVVSPDLGQVAQGAALPDLVCPPGFGYMFQCDNPCIPGTYNDGNYMQCMQCPAGMRSTADRTGCEPIPRTTCPAGTGDLATNCDHNCTAGTYNDGTFGDCRACPAGQQSAVGATLCTPIVPTTCRPGRGNAPKCDVCCKSQGKVNDGSFASCQACPPGKKANNNATACIDIITSCPAGRELDDDSQECSGKCKKGNYNNGQLTHCLACPGDMESDDDSDTSRGATRCIYTVCPPGKGNAPLCENACTGGLYNPGTFTSCQACPSGRTSKDGRTCVFMRCPPGQAGDACDISCGAGRFQDGTATVCSSCPAGLVSSEDRSSCVQGVPAGSCTPRPATSQVTFTCPPGWTKLQGGATRTAPPRCITTAAAGSSCATAWSAEWGANPGLEARGDASGKLVCACSNAGTQGRVLKINAAGVWTCAADAVFLPTNGVGTDSPNIQDTTAGIWYDLLPGRTCEGAQACWDMCFFCDGRPKYHQDFPAAAQTAARDTAIQQQGDCASTSSCKLSPQVTESVRTFYDACRRWSQEINYFGNQQASLRALYNNAAETNSFEEDKEDGERLWPYRPRDVSTTQNLIMFGLQSQAAAKCSDCFTVAKAELVDKAVARAGCGARASRRAAPAPSLRAARPVVRCIAPRAFYRGAWDDPSSRAMKEMLEQAAAEFERAASRSGMSGAVYWPGGSYAWGAASRCGPQRRGQPWQQQQQQQGGGEASCALSLDVVASEDSYQLLADVPGLAKADLKIRLSKDRVLTIAGERRAPGAAPQDAGDAAAAAQASGEGAPQLLQQERRAGAFSRAWALPEDADEAGGISAKVSEGVLTIRVPKRTPVPPPAPEDEGGQDIAVA